MVDYRIYRLSADNRIVGHSELIAFESDEEAIAHAKSKLDGLDIEVWQGPRRVIWLRSTDE